MHDFNPGFSSTDVFWTLPVATGAVAASGSAVSLKVTGARVHDEKNVQNALRRGAKVPAVVSYDVRWSGANFADVVRNAEQRFVISFVEGTASVSWSGETADWMFAADPGAKVNYAAVGSERNGKFYS